MQRKVVLLILIAFAVVGLDQATKFLVVKDLTHRLDGITSVGAQVSAMYAHPAGANGGMFFWPKRSITISQDFFRIRYAENTGAAWGLLRNLPDSVRGPLFHVISWIAVIAILYYYLKLSRSHPEDLLSRTGLALILGGAVGNYIDRLTRGFVVDFIEVHWFDKAAWPSFNIADSAICIGAALILIESFRKREKKSAVVSTL